MNHCCVCSRYLKGSCEMVSGSCPLSHNICKEKVWLEIKHDGSVHITSLTCRCLPVLSSYEVFASEKVVLTFMLVWGRMPTFA